MRPAPFAASSPADRTGDRATTTKRSIAAGRKARLRRAALGALESLEVRALMAVLPAVTSVAQADVSDGQALAFNHHESTPTVVVNPNNPLQVVALSTHYGPDLPSGNILRPTQAQAEGAFSVDGGVNWLGFNAQPGFLPDGTQNPPVPLIVSGGNSVAFDRDNNFYVAQAQYGGSTAVGAIVLYRYSFGSDGPSLDSRVVVYEWGTANAPTEQALNPVVAVDSGTRNFVDPDTGAVQVNKFSDDVYVAWTASDPSALPLPTQSIKVSGSSDGGQNFTAPVRVSDGSLFNTAVQATVLQGRAVASGATPDSLTGKVAFTWDNYDPNNPNFDTILADSATAVAFQRFRNPSLVAILDPAAPPTGQPAIPKTITSTIHVDLTGDIKFDQVDDLNVEVSITHPQISDIQIRLIPPVGSGLPTITLLRNRTNADGTSNGATVGSAGADLGSPTSFLGSIRGTVFDAQANASVVGAFGPASTGYFRPDGGNLSAFAGLDKVAFTGDWTLEITDFANSGTTPPPVQFLNSWGLQFTSGLTPGRDSAVASTTVRGTLAGPYTTASPASPTGIAPAPAIAADNTLGSFSPHPGRIYVAYVDRFNTVRDGAPAAANPADNTDIRMRFSDDGGRTWQGSSDKVNDDAAADDGFSGSLTNPNVFITGRPQFQPALAVDQTTGTLAVSFLDARNDAAHARVATYVATSIDGGSTFGPQTFVNEAQVAFDVVSRKTVVLGPIPENASVNPAQGFGTHQGLAFAAGRIYAAYAGNGNGGSPGQLNGAYPSDTMDIRVSVATTAAGPRVVSSTMGPVASATVLGTTFNNTRGADGTPLLDGFAVTFDRLIDARSFTAADIQVVYRLPDGTVGPAPAIASVTPLNRTGPLVGGTRVEATTFLVRFATQQTGTGTYSYIIRPTVSDLIRYTSDVTGDVTGNASDQNADAVEGQFDADAYDAPSSTGSVPLQASFDGATLPLILYGPTVVDSAVVGVTDTDDNLVLDKAASAIRVTFDRDMLIASFTAADILQVLGPAGLIAGPFTVSPVLPAPVDPSATTARTFEIGFPIQRLSGTYTILLGPDIQSARGDSLDINRNAGLDALRGTIDPATGATTVITANSTAAVAIPAGSTDTPATITSQITVGDAFPIQDLNLRLNIAFADPSASTTGLTATLITPQGDRIVLFDGVGAVGGTPGFADTVFDDDATTLIADGGPPYRGRFKPQQPLDRPGTPGSAGLYTLEITNTSGFAATLNNWALLLTRAVSGTGLGEPVADRATLDFRIFTSNATTVAATSSWTPVGPAAIAGESSTGRVSALAVDPSDPSGNTVYVAGASGGVWKTTNFLTTSPQGPTYQPLTDFGPTLGLNISSLAVFGRNNDPNQSVIFAATGEGATNSRGVGLLRSMDGGATWTVLDSTRNGSDPGVIVPIDSTIRDHAFVNSTTYKVVVDPRPTTSGGVIVYAAIHFLDDPANPGALYRSFDSGETWEALRTGTVTDIVLDPNSGPIDAVLNPTGNLQNMFVAYQGEGVFFSANQGSNLVLRAGGVGKPLVRDGDTTPSSTIPVAAPADTPTGAKGRIILAKPDLLPGADLQNTLYQGWLYALVANPAGGFDGLYMTKDFGQNWTKVHIPGVLDTANNAIVVVPTNDPTLADTRFVPQSLAVDPNDPNVVFVGASDANSIYNNALETGRLSSLIRVDTTGISDPHAFFLDNDNPDGGLLRANTNDPVTLKSPTTPAGPRDVTPDNSPLINLYQDPNSPFSNNATVLVNNVAMLGNSGSDSHWVPFNRALQPDPYLTTNMAGPRSEPMDGVQRILAIRDPLTGKTRLILGTFNGVNTVVTADSGREILGSIGDVQVADTTAGDLKLVNGTRNGNLQLAQFYYGAAQPSQAAADISTLRGFFYGGSLQNGEPTSAADVLAAGNTDWAAPGRGTGSGVATDQTGSGTVYQYKWPAAGGNVTNFFQVNGVGRTTGLIQQSLPGNVPDPQWPALSPTYAGGHPLGNFSVNPINGDQIIISSAAGRVFGTVNQGRQWQVIGEPSALDGTAAEALAYGAPASTDPTASTNAFLYAGTVGGHIFVTFNGGGGGTNGNWVDISAGLDGSAVQAIVTNPTRATREAYAVTLRGVFHIEDSAAAGATWQNITGDVFAQGHLLFNDPALGSQVQAIALNSLQVDWRYVIPDDFAAPAGPSHPILYVGALGGVYRSIDDGTSWRLFPDVALNSAPAEGGYLPNVQVTDLDLSLGNINPTTGRPDVSTGENLLLATTFGRGSFSIRLAPLVFPNSPTDNLILRIAAADDSGPSSTDGVTSVSNPTIQGFSEQTAFGNVVTIGVFDVTGLTDAQIADIQTGRNTTPPPQIGLDPTVTNRTNTAGQFAVKLAANYFRTDGLKKLLVQATNASGTKGNYALLSFVLDTTPPGQGITPGTPSTPDLLASSDSGLSPTDPVTTSDNITNITENLAFTVTLAGDLPITDPVTNNRIFLVRDTDSNIVATTDAAPNATVTLVDPGPVPEGKHTYYVYQIDLADNKSALSGKLTVTIDTTPPAAPGTPVLDTSLPSPGGSDSGTPGDNITNVSAPYLTGTAEPGGVVEIVDSAGNVLSAPNVVTPNVAANGKYSIPTLPLASGTYVLRVREKDKAGNLSGVSGPITVRIIVGAPVTPTLALVAADDSGTVGDNVTNVTRPRLSGRATPGLNVQLYLVSGNVIFPGGVPAGGIIAPTLTQPPVIVRTDGTFQIQFPNDLPSGTFVVKARVIDQAGNFADSPNLTLQILTGGAVGGSTAIALLPADDTGTKGDNATAVRRPRIVGTAFAADGRGLPGAQVELVTTAGVILTTAVSGPTGAFTLNLPSDLSNGRVDVLARVRDVAGNPGASSNVIPLRILSVTGDADGDAQADLDSYSFADGQFSFTKSASPANVDTSLGFQTGDVPLQGDFDGDGKLDYGYYRVSTGTWIVRQSRAGLLQVPFGTAGQELPIQADYDGDGRTDLATWRPSDSTWTILTSSTGSVVSLQFGVPGQDQPVPADYDGDGRADLAVFRNSTAQWLAFLSTGANAVANTFGPTPGQGQLASAAFGLMNQSTPVPADYDGDGKADLAVYATAGGVWFLAKSGGGQEAVGFGYPGLDIPAPADYDADGKADLATFRPNGPAWFIRDSSSPNTSIALGAGKLGDVPLVAPLSFRYRSRNSGNGGTVTTLFAPGGGPAASFAAAGTDFSTRADAGPDLGGTAASFAANTGGARAKKVAAKAARIRARHQARVQAKALAVAARIARQAARHNRLVNAHHHDAALDGLDA